MSCARPTHSPPASATAYTRPLGFDRRGAVMRGKKKRQKRKENSGSSVNTSSTLRSRKPPNVAGSGIVERYRGSLIIKKSLTTSIVAWVQGRPEDELRMRCVGGVRRGLFPVKLPVPRRVKGGRGVCDYVAKQMLQGLHGHPHGKDWLSTSTVHAIATFVTFTKCKFQLQLQELCALYPGSVSLFCNWIQKLASKGLAFYLEVD